MIKPPAAQIPGVYHRRVGDITVTAISDGFLDGNLDVMKNIDPDEARRILAENFRPARRTVVGLRGDKRIARADDTTGRYRPAHSDLRNDNNCRTK